MNKMFTAVATLQLVEAGRISLDDPIARHLPAYLNREVASRLTVRQLLSHTGGNVRDDVVDQMRRRLQHAPAPHDHG